MEVQWRAKWIWAESGLRAPDFYLYARKEIECGRAARATAHVTASSQYKLYVNGRCIGRGPMPPDPGCQYYDEYDLTRVLRPGKNVIAAICRSPDGPTAVGPGSRDRGPTAGFLLQIEIAENGGATVLGTDETWKVKPAHDYASGLKTAPKHGRAADRGEVYDTQRKPVGWNVAGFDDSEWEDAFVIGDAEVEPWTRVVPREIPRLREWEAFPKRVAKSAGLTNARGLLNTTGGAAVIKPGRESFVTLDFGRRVVGFPVIRVRDSGLATIEIGYAVGAKHSDESAATHPQGIPAECFAPTDPTDRLTVHGGRREWQAFNRRVFRYLQLTVRDLDSPLQIESVSVVCIGYPVEQVSAFECSDELLNEVWRAGVYTLSLCMQDLFEANPLDDPHENPADARVQALVNYYCFFDTGLPRQALRRFAALPEPDPIWVSMLHDYYLHAGDRSLVAELYSAVRELLEERLATSEPNAASGSAFHYQALRDAAKLASAVGEIDDALTWHERAESVLRAFNERFWCEERGAYVDSTGSEAVTSLANALAVLFGLADTNRRDRIAHTLLSTDIAQPGSQGFHLLEAMARLGMGTECLDLIRSEWGEELRRWGGFSWGSSGAPAYVLSASILGVRPSLPESGVVVIQPRVGDLEWARGRVKTHNSLVEVEWRSEPGRFVIDINAPEGFVLGLPIGRFRSPRIEEIDISPDTAERLARRTYGWGTTIWRDGEERDPYVDWLRTQEAEPPDSYERRKRCSIESDYVWVRECLMTQVRYEVHEVGEGEAG